MPVDRSRHFLFGFTPIIRGAALFKLVFQFAQRFLRGRKSCSIQVDFGLFGLCFIGEIVFDNRIHFPCLLNLQQIQFIFGKLLLMFGIGHVLARRSEAALPIIAGSRFAVLRVRKLVIRFLTGGVSGGRGFIWR